MKTIEESTILLTEEEQKSITGGSNLGFAFGIYVVALGVTLMPLQATAYYTYEYFN